MREGLSDTVAGIMRRVAAETILPRFKTLQAGEVEEKGPGALVTVADREAETALAAELATLLPGSRPVGEELVAERPELLDGLAEGRVWLIDPLDGTANFAAGRGPFAVMVTLLQAGEAVAGWILDPLGDVLVRAERGAGAFLGAERVRTPAGSPGLPGLRGAVLMRYLPEPLKTVIAPGCARLGEVLPGMRCAGAEYPAIVAGRQHFTLFWRTLPWDHAAGILVLTEAGGHAARFDGAPYRLGDRRPGLLAARNAAVWAEVHAALLGREETYGSRPGC